MLVEALKKLMRHESLSVDEARETMRSLIMDVPSCQVAALLTLLSYRPVTMEELNGMRQGILAHAMKISSPAPVMDIVGTGGDGANTVNISTGAAILASAGRVLVMKHGNRAITSRCGAADVLEALGIAIDLAPEAIMKTFTKVGIAFIFAQSAHPLLAKLKPIRQSLPFKTVINTLGPLLNPVAPAYLLLGVANKEHLQSLSQLVASFPEIKRALVYHGQGLDELTPLGVMDAYEVQNGQCTPLTIDPKDFGFAPCNLTDLQGGEAEQNARLLQRVLAGESNPIADSLILTAGAALWVYGISESLAKGIAKARQLHQSGAGLQRLTEWVTHHANI